VRILNQARYFFFGFIGYGNHGKRSGVDSVQIT
jgi:hypothetical protein